jgi:hypothetical protein
MSSFTTYLIGFIILIVGLAIAAFLLNVPTPWIIVGVIVLLGFGVLMATSRTRTRDVPHPPQPPQPPQPPPGGYGQGGYPPAGGSPPPPGGPPPSGPRY